MSIDKQHGEVIFICDGCDDTLETAEVDWGPAWELAKEEGWRAFKVKGEWLHHCPDCD